MHTEVKIGFIGGGNMASSLIGGLIADGTPAENIQVGEPSAAQRSALQERFAIRVTAENREVAETADVVVLAVKPQMLHEVCTAILDEIRARRPLVVSVAAGVRTGTLERWLGGPVPLVRAMPNTPSLVQSGATALFANAAVDEGQREQAEGILRAVGLTLWVEEEAAMDSVTALSGSGPAYFFLMMEALEAAGAELGLPAESARLLTLQTAFGAAKMALESPEPAAGLRRRVTSPGGTTERAINLLQEGGMEPLIARAVAAARARAAELADELDRT